jgi:membrane protease YdiL (CAAX protease family)
MLRPFFIGLFSPIGFEIAETSTKLLVWTLPAITLIRYYQNDIWISLKEMVSNKPNWFKREKLENLPKFFAGKEPLIVYILIPFLIIPQALLFSGELVIHPDLKPIRWIEMVLFVGITEEILFRGWLLNAFIKKYKPLTAIVFNQILFVAAHFPIWIYFEYKPTDFLVNSASVFALGFLFALSFIKSKNIFVPIFIHMSWNFLITLFYGMGQY